MKGGLLGGRAIRGMYGSRIYIPPEKASTSASNEYKEDLRRRRNEGKLLPGDALKTSTRRCSFWGQIAVMAISGALSKLCSKRIHRASSMCGREFVPEPDVIGDRFKPSLLSHVNSPHFVRQTSTLIDAYRKKSKIFSKKRLAPVPGDGVKLIPVLNYHAMKSLLVSFPQMKLLPEAVDSAAKLASPRYSAFHTEPTIYGIEALQARARSVGPLVEGIFNIRPPIRWGINE